MGTVSVKVLGCGDAFGSGGRFNTCFYVQTSRLRFLVDCGGTSLVALKKHGMQVEDIDAILITHFHGDHYGGVPFLLLHAAKIEKRQRPLTIVTPPGGKERIQALTENLYPGAGIFNDLDLYFVSYEGEQQLDIHGLMVESFPVVHAPDSLPHGFRIQADDKILSFSGDTQWTDKLIPLSENADLFICECNFFDTEGPAHLNYKQLEQKKTDMSFKNIYLNHLGEEMLARLNDVKMPVLEDGQEIEV